MRKHIILKAGLVSAAAAFIVVGNAAVFALPVNRPVHSPLPVTTVPPTNPTGTSSGSGSGGTSSGGTTSPQPATAPGQTSGQSPLTAPQQRACQNRANAINTIMGRIDTRTQNQITLFGTIATRVENFYTSKSKTVSNYDQLTAAITAAKTQAETDLTTMQSSGTIDCSGSNPKGTVTAFQGSLKTATADLKNYRTAVKNLITAVATANGVTVSNSSNAANSQGGQQ